MPARTVTPSNKPRQLVMMKAALRIVENLSAGNDRRAHTEERNNASQHSQHDRLPRILFLNAAIVSLAVWPVCIVARHFAITFSRTDANFACWRLDRSVSAPCASKRASGGGIGKSPVASASGIAMAHPFRLVAK
jgi:hypothetical protein